MVVVEFVAGVDGRLCFGTGVGYAPGAEREAGRVPVDEDVASPLGVGLGILRPVVGAARLGPFERGPQGVKL